MPPSSPAPVPAPPEVQATKAMPPKRMNAQPPRPNGLRFMEHSNWAKATKLRSVSYLPIPCATRKSNMAFSASGQAVAGVVNPWPAPATK